MSDSNYVWQNTVKSLDRAVFLKANRRSVYQCNQFMDITEDWPYSNHNKDWSGMNAWYANPDPDSIYAQQGAPNITEPSIQDAILTDYTIAVKRWTGPEWVTFKDIVRTNTFPGDTLPAYADCNCLSPCIPTNMQFTDASYLEDPLPVFIEENKEHLEVLISPNPVSNHCQIRSPKGLIRLFSANGEALGEFFTKGNLSMSLSHLPSGIYLVRFQNDEQISLFKIIKL
jgi:hypothetical protein